MREQTFALDAVYNEELELLEMREEIEGRLLT